MNIVINKNIDRIKAKITSKELVLNGTVAERYKQCGKVTCRCYEDKKFWHGPYWIWTRKVNGKTITKTLRKEQAVLVRSAIKEMKDLNLIIDKWKTISLKEIEKL